AGVRALLAASRRGRVAPGGRRKGGAGRERRGAHRHRIRRDGGPPPGGVTRSRASSPGAALRSLARPPTARHRMRDSLITAIAPIAWGTTYFVTTEFLPPDRPLLVGALRALPIGVLLAVVFRRAPAGVWWWRALVLGTLNVGLVFALLFTVAYR